MSYAGLKRLLVPGKKLICTYHFKGEDNAKRERIIAKVNTTGVYTNQTGLPKPVFMEFPKTVALVEMHADGSFSFYQRGTRLLTEAEQNALTAARNTYTKEEAEYDALTDGSTTYYKEKHYLEDHGFGYLNKNMDWNYRDENGKQVLRQLDNQVKGLLLYTFKVE